jgi:hypothetical protein
LPQHSTAFSFVAWSAASPATETVPVVRRGGRGLQRRVVRRCSRRSGLFVAEQLFAGFLDETDDAHGLLSWWLRVRNGAL